jgi:hypothetical protein
MPLWIPACAGSRFRHSGSDKYGDELATRYTIGPMKYPGWPEWSAAALFAVLIACRAASSRAMLQRRA